MSVIVDAIAFLHSMPFRRRMSNAEAHEKPITLGLEAPMNYVASCSGTAGTHKRTYRIRSKVHSELVLHIIVSTAYTSTIFKKNKN